MGHGEHRPDRHLPLQAHGDVERHDDEEDQQGTDGLVGHLVSPGGADLLEGLHRPEFRHQDVTYRSGPDRILDVGPDEEHLAVHYLDPGIAGIESFHDLAGLGHAGPR